MGAPPGEWAQARYSTNQVQVTLTRPFEIGKTLLTRGAWKAAGFPEPSQHVQYGTADCLDLDCPQGDINFFDAISFANQLSVLKGFPPCYALANCTGKVGSNLSCASVRTTAASVYECTGYRLPTEAEWEYAARAGAKTPFFTGGISPEPDLDCYDEPNLDPIGWYCFNSDKRAHPVARKAANGWGLYDASGNVSEWCNDLFKPRGYGTGPLRDPSGMLGDSSDLTLVAGEQFRIARGGDYLMPAYMSKNNWQVDFPDSGFAANIGVRLARTLFGAR
jgi:formylglycine-generating enzyme required for sulfatase activity